MQGKQSGKVWRVIELITWTTGYFQRQGISSARLDAEVLLAHVLGTDRVGLYVRFQQPVPPALLARYRELIKRRAERMPLAYLIHQREFMGLSFYVDSHVLIPRPETEVLVEYVESVQQGPAAILEIGTGSGAIAVSLAKRQGWAVDATDVSEAALAIARRNGRAHGVEAQIRYFQGNLFDAIPQGVRYDWILSNPPYIPSAMLADLEPEIRYEPRIALDGGTDGLDVIRPLVAQAPDYLLPAGRLLFEIGQDQADTICAWIEAHPAYVSCTVLQDYAHVDRFILAQRTS